MTLARRPTVMFEPESGASARRFPSFHTSRKEPTRGIVFMPAISGCAERSVPRWRRRKQLRLDCRSYWTTLTPHPARSAAGSTRPTSSTRRRKARSHLSFRETGGL